MKKLIILSAIAVGGLFYNTANAQIRFHIGVRLFPRRVYVQPAVADVQPAPVEYGDDNQADDNAGNDYYYLPDVGAYYNVNEQCYYYFDGDNWISAAYLPGYENYNWRDARRFEVRSPRPYLHDDVYRARFHGAEGNWAHYSDHFRRDDRNLNAYRGGNDQRFGYRGRNDQRFDNRGNDQHFDNRGQSGAYGQQNDMNNRGGQQTGQNRGRENNGGQQSNQNTNHSDNHMGDQQQHVAQNNRGYDGHHSRG